MWLLSLVLVERLGIDRFFAGEGPTQTACCLREVPMRRPDEADLPISPKPKSVLLKGAIVGKKKRHVILSKTAFVDSMNIS